MYKIFFNNIEFAISDNEDFAIGLALNLHKSSNISHNIVVTNKDVNIINLFNDVPNDGV